MQHLKIYSLAFLLASPALALESDRQQKVTLDGGGCVTNYKNNSTECPNGITITQGSMVIKAKYGLINHENKGIQSVKMTGEPAHFEQKMDSGELMVIKAQAMDYIKEDEKIYLNGSVVITSELGVTRGETMEINLLTQEISSVSDDPEERFFMEITPDKQQ